MENIFLKEVVIEKFGGVEKAAEFFGCKRQAIYQWQDNKPIPKKRQLECLLYHPELFGNPTPSETGVSG